MGEEAAKTAAVVEWLQGGEEEMAALLAELVAIPTENPPGKNYRVCADFLEKRLKQVGLDCERLEDSETKEGKADIPICLVAENGQGEHLLYFQGHYNVVPAQSPASVQPVHKAIVFRDRCSSEL